MAVLVGAAAAYAASNFDTFTATQLFCKSTASFTAKTCAPATAGSKAKPVPYGMVGALALGGIQLVGRPGADALVLGAGLALEAALKA